jgi:hypothetical protein
MTKRIINKVSYYLLFALVIMMICVLAYTALSNPQLTQTQIFLMYWKGYAVTVACALGLYFIISKTEEI